MFKYVLPIYTMASDEEIWCATGGMSRTMLITGVCIDNTAQAINDAWKLVDYDEGDDLGIANFNVYRLGEIFSGKNDSHKVSRVRVDADGTVTIEITEISTRITRKYLVNSCLKPSFDIIVRDGNGAPVEKYSIKTSMEDTTVTEYPLNGGKPIDLESLVAKRIITLKAAEPDRCFVTETD